MSKEQRLGESIYEERIYELVANEFSRGELSAGLWLRAFAEAGGDEPLAKAQYLRLRTEQIRLGIDVGVDGMRTAVGARPQENLILAPAPVLQVESAAVLNQPRLTVKEQIAAIYAGRASCKHCGTKNIRPAGGYSETGRTSVHECITCRRRISGDDLILTEQVIPGRSS